MKAMTIPANKSVINQEDRPAEQSIAHLGGAIGPDFAPQW
jgi:hypothetical protein